jgi:hypothetical protein
MSVMDMNSRMAMAEKLSVQQLQQAIQSGSLPAYIGIPLIEQKNKEKSQMAAAQQGQQKPPSVASQILQQAEQGVAQLPSNLPEQGMAGGGIVAFAEGGDADDFDVEAYREQEEEDEYANSLSALVAAAQAAAEEGVSSRKKDKKYAYGGAVRFQDAGQVFDADAMTTMDRLREENPELYRRILLEQEGPQLGVNADTRDYSGNAQEGSGIPSLGPALSGNPMRDTPYKVGAPYREDLPPETTYSRPTTTSQMRELEGIKGLTSSVAADGFLGGADVFAPSIEQRMEKAADPSDLRRSFDSIKRREAPTELFDADAFKEDEGYRAFVEAGGYRGNPSLRTYLSLGNPPPPSMAAENRRIDLEETADEKEKRDVAYETAVDRRELSKATGTIAAGAKDIGTLGLEGLNTGADYLARLANQFGANLPRVSPKDKLGNDRPAFSNFAEYRRRIAELGDPGGTAVMPDSSQKNYGMGNMDALSGTTFVPKPKDQASANAAPGEKSTGIDGLKPSATSSGAGTTQGGGSLGGGSGRITPTSLVNQLSEQTGKPRSAYDDFLDEIREGRKDLKTQAEKDKYMAMIAAGLGMMSGTSPNAFANIGQGAQAGVASYMASAKQRAAEKAALNKNLLMGRRYQSMEDIANRTADINERRVDAIAAARGAGGDSKAEAQLDRQENAFTTRLRNAQATVGNALIAKFGKDGAIMDPKGYAKAEQELTQQYVNPVIKLQERFLAKRYPDVFGDQSNPPPPANRPPLSSFNR